MFGAGAMWLALAVLLARHVQVAVGIDLWVVDDEDVMPTSLFLSVSKTESCLSIIPDSYSAASGHQAA